MPNSLRAALLFVWTVSLAAAPAADEKGRSGGTAAAGFVRIEPGRFLMGSPAGEDGREDDEGPQVEVGITRAFLIQATEVTQGQWKATMGSNPSHFSSCGDACPVEYVTWFEAVEYANAVSRREGLEACYRISGKDVQWSKGLACKGYRLPTEAEWEYAARAGTTGARYGELDAIAWHEENSAKTTHPVGQKQANAWGLFDMIGNVWEWCWDWSADYAKGPVTDPLGPASGSYRVIRGGSWTYDESFQRAAFRNRNLPGDGYSFVGFRLVRSLPRD
jgi:formylglycine-generating enzyme required for sulfatase activity